MFQPTPRQRAGLASLERFCGIREPRTDFPDREAFAAYWDLVVARGETAKRQRTPEAEAARRERVAAHFLDEDALTRHGRAYVQRYQPSSGKLRQHLAMKCADSAVCDRALARLAESLDDRARIRELAEILQRQGRHARAIRDKLRQRLFPLPLIDACLESLTDAGEGSLLDPAALDRQVAKLSRKGLSKRAMQGKLMGGAGDRGAVQAALGQTDDTQALRAAYAKLARRPRPTRELTQRLLAKGFRYPDITALLKEIAGGT